MKLDFLIAGINKCGSTTLTSLIGKHTDIFISPSKDDGYVEGTGLKKNNGLYPGWESCYRHHFSGRPANKKPGEGNVGYSSKPLEDNASKFLLDVFPDIKLIFIVRDPIKRIESSFKEKHASGCRWGTECPYTIEKALIKFPDLIDTSLYCERISHYLNLFPEENCHIVFLEDLIDDFTMTLNSCFEFLGVDPAPYIKPEIRNLSHSKYFDTPGLRAMRNAIWQPETGLPLSKLPLDIQDQFLAPLGLRRPMHEFEVSWSDKAIEFTLNAISKDIKGFLGLTGRKSSIWKKYDEFLNSA